MQVFDFDKTIYKGISSFEFAFEAIKREPQLLKYSKIMVSTVFRYLTNKLKLYSIEDLIRENIKVVIDRKELIDNISLTFWNEKRLKRLNKDVLKLVHDEDVICSTSPSFVIEGVRNSLPTKNIITTQVDFETGDLFLNFKRNKVDKIKELYPDSNIENLYTDSYTDRPLMEVAKNVYLVKGKSLKKIK